MSQSIAHPAAYLAEGAMNPHAPFDFAQTLRFVGAFTPAAGEQTTDGGTLRKAVMIQRRPVVFTVRSSGSIEQPHLDYSLATATPITTEVERAAVDRILSAISSIRPPVIPLAITQRSATATRITADLCGRRITGVPTARTSTILLECIFTARHGAAPTRMARSLTKMLRRCLLAQPSTTV